jgi:hypothetical protein
MYNESWLDQRSDTEKMKTERNLKTGKYQELGKAARILNNSGNSPESGVGCNRKENKFRDSASCDALNNAIKSD